MHTGIGSVLSQAHLAKVTEIFAGLPLIGFFVVLAFVILENLLGFPVIYIGALVELHSIIVIHALYYTRLGLDCQAPNTESWHFWHIPEMLYSFQDSSSRNEVF